MKIRLLPFALCLAVLFCRAAPAAEPLPFYFIYPDGEGDAESAAPYLDEFYSYISEKAGLALSGTYLNDAGEALDAIKGGRVKLAVVAPDFYATYREKEHLAELLKTIPVYAGGPYEKYYLYCGEDMIPSRYAAQRTPVTIHASRAYPADFIDGLLREDAGLRNVTFRARKAPDILAAMRGVSQGQDASFVLLSGYENSVLEKIKSSSPDFAGLKLVLASSERPSAPLVSVGDAPSAAELAKLRKTLLEMARDARGKKILADLRLAGFAP